MVSIRKLFREPLLHFLLIGAALFVFYGLTRDVDSEAPNRILVTSSQVEQLKGNFKRTWMRSPTQGELDALIDNFVREEVFYREALAMGLDQNDPLVKRRMRMKLEMMLEDLSVQEVTDEALEAYLQENAKRFRTEAQISFRQVYLNPDKREDLEGDAMRFLVSLNGGVSPDTLGDATLLPADFELATRSNVVATFGERFAETIMKRKPRAWTGPVYSAYGAHLIKINEYIEMRQPDLAEVREVVEREYLVQLRNKQKDLAYGKLRRNYDVTVETATAALGQGVDLMATAQAGQAQ
jgi:hypothetical protein